LVSRAALAAAFNLSSGKQPFQGIAVKGFRANGAHSGVARGVVCTAAFRGNERDYVFPVVRYVVQPRQLISGERVIGAPE